MLGAGTLLGVGVPLGDAAPQYLVRRIIGGGPLGV